MVELYIDGHKADLTTNISVPMNYELEKLENPTIIKNNFSKTVSLPATPNNNKIFGFYYELDKVYNGYGFNAIKRIPFELYRDSDLIETGYLQLNNIKYKGNTYTYDITLYGGLGDFLYSLAYDEKGNEKTLADLNYGLGENDEDFKFQMNADFVTQCWDNTWVSAGSQLDGGVITFIPSYNGLYDNFSNDKALVNSWSTAVFPSMFVNSEDYTNPWEVIDGFGLATLNNELTEWQMRDLRCYKQRPALRLEAFIKAICKPENNGGYEVELDGVNFFNRENPYYNKTWIALPLLNPDSEEWPETTKDLTLNPTANLNCNISGYYEGYNDIDFTDVTFTSESEDILYEAGGNSSININCDFSLKVTADSNDSKLWFSDYVGQVSSNSSAPAYSCVGVWLEASVDGMLIGVSDCVILGQSIGNTYISIDKYSTTMRFLPTTNFIYYNGTLNKISDKTYLYEGYLRSGEEQDTKLSNTFRLSIKNVPNYQNIKFTLKSNRWWNGNAYYAPISKESLFGNSGRIRPTNITVSDIITPDATVNLNSNRKTLQNVTITKSKLLKNKITPASLLLSFTKLFGLYFVKDINKKKIKIVTKNKFFENAKVVDIDNKIDYSNEVKIEPLLFNKKWYTLKCPALETSKMKKFESDYLGIEYGQKRLNTNYNFNTDEEDLYKENQYQNVITILDSSKYYRNFIHKEYDSYVPPFMIDGCKYTLWQNGSLDNSKEIEIKSNEALSISKPPVQFGTLVGQDAFPKLCCFDEDNDKQKLNEIDVSLVFYNGLQYLYDSDGDAINYTISNDLPLMGTLNDGEPMYLCTNTEMDANHNRICVLTNRLPQFTRYNIEFGNIVNSLDFGVPLETYIDVNYTEDSTLYNNFWKKFYTDQFDENTRKVTAYVKFDDVQLGNHSLSDFYYFNNCYWLLNKIVDYDLANPQKKVKCEFIKVNNRDNYTNGQKIFTTFYEINPEFDGLRDWNVITDAYVNYGGSWEVEFTAPYGIKEISTNGKYTLTQNGDKYRLTIYDITDDIGVYISGYREYTTTVSYRSDATVPEFNETKYIEMSVYNKGNYFNVWSNPIDDVDNMDIRFPDGLDPSFRIKPNINERVLVGCRVIATYYDGTTYQLSFSVGTEQWVTLPFYKQGNEITNLDIRIYSISFVQSTRGVDEKYVLEGVDYSDVDDGE